MTSIVRRHILVSGRVQGVGYRFFVVDEADRLGLRGWVRNLPDGTVEAEVEGRDTDIEELVGQLRVGPRAGHVTNVVVESVDGLAGHRDFQIR